MIAEVDHRKALRKEKGRRELARRNLLDFCKYVFPLWQDAPFRTQLCKVLDRFARGELKRLIVTVPPQHGKAQRLDTPIPTPSGFTAIGALQVGDEVFAADGSITRVKAVSPIWRDRELWKVTADDGSTVVVDGEHEWRVRLDRKRPVWKNYTTAFLAARTSPRNPMIQQAGALQTPEQELIVPPYTLGAWLGDGTSCNGSICKQIPDEQIYLREQLALDGYETRVRSDGKMIGVMKLQAGLEQIGVLHHYGTDGYHASSKKFIPRNYLRASISQRLALLQGLMDTDGYVALDGQCDYCTTSRQLAADVRELVHSLGVKAQLYEARAMLDGRDCGPKFRVCFYMAEAARLPRKAARCRNAEVKTGRYLTFEPAGRGDTVCIEVEHPSHLFLCGTGMLPTHNSLIVSEHLPAYLLGREPTKRVVTASYNDELANKWGRSVRRIITSPEYAKVFPTVTLSTGRDSYTAKADEFDIIGGRGGYKCVGAKEGIAGHPAHFIIIDDPYKDRADAESRIVREARWEWYTSAIYTRQNPAGNAPICILHTRWHEDDLIGRLLAREKTGGDKWEQFNFPALDEQGNGLLFPRAVYDQIRANVTARDWQSLYMQSPMATTGEFFKRQWFRYWDDDAGALKIGAERFPYGRRFATVDLAASEKQTADYTVIASWSFALGRLFLIDIDRRRMEGPDLVPAMRAAMVKNKLSEIYVEKVGMQLVIIQQAAREGLPVRELLADKKKEERAYAATPWFEQGKVAFKAGAPWLSDVEHELLGFPNAAHDDIVDAVSYACAVAFKGNAPSIGFGSSNTGRAVSTALSGILPK